MDKQRFTEILKEYDYTDAEINLLWAKKPEGVEIKEEGVRFAAVHTKPLKHILGGAPNS